MNIEIPEHSYFYGFALTDGHLRETTRNRGGLSIEIGYKDYNIIEKFKKMFPLGIIKTRSRITNFSKGVESKTVCIRFNHLTFREKLKSYGFPVGKKSDIVSTPSGYYSKQDFWRGVIDGDGSLGFTNKNFPYISLVTKSESLANSYKDLIMDIVGYRPETQRNKRDNVYNIMIIKENAIKLITYLYYDNCVGVDRKLKSANEIKQWIRPEEMRIVGKQRKWTIEDMEYIKTHTVLDSMHTLNRTKNSVLMKLRKVL